MIKKLKEDEKIKTNIPDSPFEDDEEKDEEKDIKEMMNVDYKTMMGFTKKQQKEKVVKEYKPSIIDNLKEEFSLDEGSAGEYAKAYTDVKKTYGTFWDSVHEFEYLLKSKGLGKHAKELNKQYKNGVEKFFKFFFKMMDKLQ